jgi:hypothetical protein
MRWAGHVARIGEGRTELCTGLWWESPKERRHSDDRGVDGRMRSEWILGGLVEGGVEWIRLAQDGGRWRVVNTVMKPSGFGTLSYCFH